MTAPNTNAFDLVALGASLATERILAKKIAELESKLRQSELVVTELRGSLTEAYQERDSARGERDAKARENLALRTELDCAKNTPVKRPSTERSATARTRAARSRTEIKK